MLRPWLALVAAHGIVTITTGSGTVGTVGNVAIAVIVCTVSIGRIRCIRLTVVIGITGCIVGTVSIVTIIIIRCTVLSVVSNVLHCILVLSYWCTVIPTTHSIDSSVLPWLSLLIEAALKE